MSDIVYLLNVSNDLYVLYLAPMYVDFLYFLRKKKEDAAQCILDLNKISGFLAKIWI